MQLERSNQRKLLVKKGIFLICFCALLSRKLMGFLGKTIGNSYICFTYSIASTILICLFVIISYFYCYYICLYIILYLFT
uniref:Uncharacterized protein n=1 Tax=Strongyloides stercoralis TaxID=6248 RepID=A0A0K0EC77_STRER